MTDWPAARQVPKREREIVELAALGQTDKEIAARLGISAETVNTYWRRIRLRYGATSRTEVIATMVREQADREVSQINSENAALIEEIEFRRNAEQRLLESEEKWRSLVENSPDHILTINPNGRVTFVNYSGASEWVELGLSLPDLASPEHRETVRRAVAEAFAHLEPRSVEFKTVQREGIAFWMSARIAPVHDSETSSQAVVIATDITQSKLHQQQLEYRLQFENLITLISTKLVGASSRWIEGAMDDALAQLGSFVAADRAYIFQFDDYPGTMSNTHEWCSEGIEPQKQMLQSLPKSAYPWWMSQINTGRPLHIPDVGELPAEAAAERQVLEAQNIQSLIVVPMIVDDEPIGFIGFDSVRRKRRWTEDAVNLLTVAGEMLAGSIARQNARTAVVGLAEKQRAILESGLELMTLTDEAEVLGKIQPAVRAFLNYEAMGLYKMDMERQMLVPFDVSDVDWIDPSLAAFQIPAGQGIVGHVIASGRGEVANNAHLDPRSAYPPGVTPPVEHMICLPIALPNGAPGALVMARGERLPPFTQQDFELVQMLVRYAEIALARAGRP